MAKPRRASPPLTQIAVWFLLATVALGIAPFLPDLPIGIQLLTVALLLWRALLNRAERPLPSRITVLLAGALAATLVLASYHTVLGKQAGLTLLVLLLPLKLMEARTRRDGRFVLMLCCFMLSGQFLNAQSLLVAAFVLLCATAIIVSSAKLEQPDIALRPALRTALRLLGGAVPLMILLFVLFPRIEGPLWGMPVDTGTATTGLSDNMQPGSIANLIQSGDIAFRVEFEGSAPPPNLRYWRGPVLSDFDGQTWSQRGSLVRDQPDYAVQGPAYRYTMTLEAHNHNWLLALDYPSGVAVRAQYANDLSLISRQPVRNRMRYRLTSYPATQPGLQEHTYVLRQALALPTGSNPRTVALGNRIRAEHPDNLADRVNAAIAFMRDDHLLYTLNPPPPGEHAADGFLFDTRRGFCEHFSSSFVIMMRAAGVPARVVTGYQGGEFNPLDGTLVVRQSDAHAWAEVWLPEQGWKRVDPTATSAPQRIEEGIANSLVGETQLPAMLRPDSTVLRYLRYRLEALGNGWNQWVLGYNSQRQFELMRSLGLRDASWRDLAALLGSLALLWLLWLGWRLWPRHARPDALDRIWQRVCRKLARRGLRRKDWESPADFARRASLRLPQHANTILALAEQYANLRYGPTGADQSIRLAAFRRAVQQFRP